MSDDLDALLERAEELDRDAWYAARERDNSEAARLHREFFSLEDRDERMEFLERLVNIYAGW